MLVPKPELTLKIGDLQLNVAWSGGRSGVIRKKVFQCLAKVTDEFVPVEWGEELAPFWHWWWFRKPRKSTPLFSKRGYFKMMLEKEIVSVLIYLIPAEREALSPIFQHLFNTIFFSVSISLFLSVILKDVINLLCSVIFAVVFSSLLYLLR